jgi:hypothetical protein
MKNILLIILGICMIYFGLNLISYSTESEKTKELILKPGEELISISRTPGGINAITIKQKSKDDTVRYVVFSLGYNDSLIVKQPPDTSNLKWDLSNYGVNNSSKRYWFYQYPSYTEKNDMTGPRSGTVDYDSLRIGQKPNIIKIKADPIFSIDPNKLTGIDTVKDYGKSHYY